MSKCDDIIVLFRSRLGPNRVLCIRWSLPIAESMLEHGIRDCRCRETHYLVVSLIDEKRGPMVVHALERSDQNDIPQAFDFGEIGLPPKDPDIDSHVGLAFVEVAMVRELECHDMIISSALSRRLVVNHDANDALDSPIF